MWLWKLCDTNTREKKTLQHGQDFINFLVKRSLFQVNRNKLLYLINYYFYLDLVYSTDLTNKNHGGSRFSWTEWVPHHIIPPHLPPIFCLLTCLLGSYEALQIWTQMFQQFLFRFPTVTHYHRGMGDGCMLNMGCFRNKKFLEKT